MGPAHAIALLIEDAGLGTLGGNSDWSIAVNGEPVKPDDTITVYDTGGPGAVLVDEDLREPTVQIRVRSHDPALARTRMDAVLAALTAPREQEVDGYRNVGIWLTTDVASLGRDEQRRERLTANLRIERIELEAS